MKSTTGTPAFSGGPPFTPVVLMEPTHGLDRKVERQLVSVGAGTAKTRSRGVETSRGFTW